MGLLGCPHKWANTGKPKFGSQGQKCRLCSRTRTVSMSFLDRIFCFHHWRTSSDPADHTRVCTLCGTGKKTLAGFR